MNYLYLPHSKSILNLTASCAPGLPTTVPSLRRLIDPAPALPISSRISLFQEPAINTIPDQKPDQISTKIALISAAITFLTPSQVASRSLFPVVPGSPRLASTYNGNLAKRRSSFARSRLIPGCNSNAMRAHGDVHSPTGLM